MQSSSQQQLPSQAPSVRSHTHDPTVVTMTVVSDGSSSTSSLHSVVEIEYTGRALVATVSVGFVCASTPVVNTPSASTRARAYAEIRDIACGLSSLRATRVVVRKLREALA